MEEKPWVILQGLLDPAKKFPSNVLKPREAAEFLKRSAGLACRTLCSPQRGVTYNHNPLFHPHGGDLDTEGRLHNTSEVAGPSSTEWLSTSRASFLLYRGIEEGEGRQGGASPVTCDVWTQAHSDSIFLGRLFLTCSSFLLMSKIFSFQAVIGDMSQS